MDKIEKILLENRDEKYREFHSSLLPNIDGRKIIGVRMPTLRKIAKSLEKDASFSNEDKNAFFAILLTNTMKKTYCTQLCFLTKKILTLR